MDSLRPDRDDLDHYNSRKNKKTSTSQAQARTSVSGAGVEKKATKGSGSKGSESVGAGYRQNVSDASAVSAGVQKTPVSGMVVSLLVLSLLLSAGLMAMFWQQSNDVKALEARLANADEFIGQSKLLIARLEGAVSETGAELQQTGTVAEKKLAVLESEVKKLWGVAYDRNRKSLKQHQESIDALEKQLVENKKAVVGLSSALSSQKTLLGKNVAALEGRVASVSGELSITRAEQEESLEGLNAVLGQVRRQSSDLNLNLKSIQGDLKGNTQSLQNNAETLASIDDSRRQLIERLVDLERRMNQLSSVGATKLK